MAGEMTKEQLLKEFRRVEERTRTCVECYRHYKNLDLEFMFNKCPYYQEAVNNGSQDSMEICLWFKITLKDIIDGQNGKKLDEGITNAGILRGIAEAGLENIPKEAYSDKSEATN